MPEGDLKTDLSFTAQINLYYDLFVPDEAAQRAPLLIAVHGYGAHKRHMMREARQVAPDNFVIASVQGPHQHFRPVENGFRVGFGWLTDHRPEESIALHHKFLLDLVGYLVEIGRVDEDRVYLYGFSQACALNFRFAFTYPEMLRGIIGVCGGIPGDIDSNPAYRTPPARVLYLYGSRDEFYPLEKFLALEQKLGEKLPDFHSRQFDAAHEITEEMRRDVREFLSEGAS